MKNDPTFWILARATGIAAYALLTVSVLAGLTVKARPFGKAVKPAAVTDFHKFLALLALGAIALHGFTLVLDRTVEITLQALVVPGIISYRPLWTGVGVASAELMLLIYLSFSARRLIGTKNWRRLHWATYGIFAAVTLHGLMAGTDTGHAWARVLYLSAIGAVIGATTWRALVRPQRPARRLPQPQEQRSYAS